MTHNTSVLSMLSWPSRGMETTDNPSVVAAASNFSAMKQNQFANVYGGDAHLRMAGLESGEICSQSGSQEFDKIYKR